MSSASELRPRAGGRLKVDHAQTVATSARSPMSVLSNARRIPPRPSGYPESGGSPSSCCSSSDDAAHHFHQKAAREGPQAEGRQGSLKAPARRLAKSTNGEFT